MSAPSPFVIGVASATRLSRGEADAVDKLCRLQAELADLAYDLEKKGRLEAADVAIATSARIGEVCAELTSPGSG